MEQNYPRSPWYDQSLPATPAKAVNSRKKRTAIKITALVLCALVLIAAVILVIFNEFLPGRSSVPPADTQSDSAESGEYTGNGFTQDFNNFFSTYSTPAETPAPESKLKRAELQTDFRVEFESTEDMEQLQLQKLYTACSPSVVAISALSERGIHWGTGFIISSNGYIITNQHIISGATLAEVILQDGSHFPAYLIGEDTYSDIAVLKIAAKNLPAVSFGDSTALTVGDEVATIGNPLSSSLTGTLTNGIISAEERTISYNGEDLPMLQTNTALNEGNSGGPLFNMYGQVVGITNMKFNSSYSEVTIEGIGFAIPSRLVKTVVNQIIATGRYSRPGLGITVSTIPVNIGSEHQLPIGLYVAELSEGSDALAKGVQVGDILTHANGIPVRQTNDLLSIRDSMQVGDEMTLTIYRDGETFDVVIILQERSLFY